MNRLQAVEAIKILARQRKYFMQLRVSATNRLVAALRGELHRDRAQDEKWSAEAKELAIKIADDLVATAERGLAGKKPRKTGLDHPLLDELWPHKIAAGSAPWLIEEKRITGEMTEFARLLGLNEWIEHPDQAGFSYRGLAIIIGHAGDLSAYGACALRKRLGLAPYAKDGVTRAGSTWGFMGGLADEDWTELGYNRARVGDLYGVITQPLFRAQWRGAEKHPSGVAGPIGPYGEVYGTYKAKQIAKNEAGGFAEEAARQASALKRRGKTVGKSLAEGRLTDGHINKRALRYMTQQLVLRLWTEWRRAIETVETKASLPAAEDSPEGDGSAANERLKTSKSVPPPDSSAKAGSPTIEAVLTKNQLSGSEDAAEAAEHRATGSVTSTTPLPDARNSDEANICVQTKASLPHQDGEANTALKTSAMVPRRSNSDAAKAVRQARPAMETKSLMPDA